MVSGASVQRSRNERVTNEKRLQKEDEKFQKELDTWMEDQGLEEMGLNELRQYALDNQIKIVESDLFGNEESRKSTLRKIIRKAEERKRTETQANQLMDEAGLTAHSFQDRVDEALIPLNILSEENLQEEIQRQGLENEVTSLKIWKI